MDNIKCSFVQKSRTLYSEGKTRDGVYHGTFFWTIPNFGRESWVIGAHIKLDDESLLEKYKLTDIADGCISYLNSIKLGKRRKKEKYSFTGVHKVALVENNMLSILLITDRRKDKNFWGVGQRVPRFIRLGRPPKNK